MEVVIAKMVSDMKVFTKWAKPNHEIAQKAKRTELWFKHVKEKLIIETYSLKD